MSIETNRLEVEFNLDAIKDDFTFIRFNRKSKDVWNGAHRLDFLLGDDYQAFSVLYKSNPHAYAMFKRPVDTYDLFSKIREDAEFSEDLVREVHPSVCKTESDDCIWGPWLAQILIHSLASSRSRYEDFHYCNLTGALLVVPSLSSKNRDHIDAFEVSLDNDYILNVRVKRYRTLFSAQQDPNTDKSDLSRKPRYILNNGTGALRRLLPRDGEKDPKEIYIRKGIHNKKAHACFIDFSSCTAYDGSRAGVLHDVLVRIQDHLSRYMSVKLRTLDVTHTVELKTTILKNPKHLRSRLINQPIHIVDLVGSKESQELIQSLKKGFPNYMEDPKLLTLGKREKKGALNYRIIHDITYYEENNIMDEHLASDANVLRQNITVEGKKGNIDAIVKTIIKEQLIKRDLRDQRLSLFDWSKLNATEAWTFASYDDVDKSIIFMTIFPDGQLEFRKGERTSLDWYGEYLDYVELLEEAKKNENWTKLSPEGLVISESGDRNIIYRTEEITIPNLREIRGIIKEVDEELPQGMRSGHDLALAMKECIANAPQSKMKGAPELMAYLNALGHQEISKKALRDILNNCLGKGSNATAYIRNRLNENYGVRLHFPKNKYNMSDLFNASLDIKYFGENGSEAYYFVGERQGMIQFSVNNACHLRRIAAIDGSKLRFREILPTMDVDFVRGGQSTVLPFPFKYIREYAKFEE